MQTPAAVATCLKWLRDALSVDDDFGQQCRTSADLCELLADGEDLCRLACVLSGGRVSTDDDDEGSVCFYSENSQLLARRNVRFFLARCADHFGLPPEALFEPEDLLEGRRPERVVATLQRLLEENRQQQVDAEATCYDMVAEAGVAQSVVSEICQSERQLTEKLQTLLRFQQELRGILSEWSPDLVSLAFQHIEELLRVHEHFYQQLAGLAAEGASRFCSGIGDLFARAKPDLAIYAKYYSHYPLAKARLEAEFKARPQLKQQLRLLEAHFKVESFSVLFDAALRQMFNYSLLFDRLLQTAGKELPAAVDSVEAALADCKALLKHFNECKRSSEKATATRQLLERVARLPDHLTRLEEVGLHRADGLFRVKRDQEPARDCYCLLTDRQLIVASRPAGAVGRRDSTSSAGSPVEYQFSVPMTEDLTLEYSGGAVLKLRRQASAGGTTLHFSKSPDASKKSGMTVCSWGQLLSQAKAFNYPDGWNSNGHSFRLQSYPGDSVCSRCREALTGYAFQGYGCDHCGLHVDRACLQIIVRLRPHSFPGAAPAVAPAAPDYADCEFFHRGLDRGAAERLLMRHDAAGPSGAFLVRENAAKKLVLSLRWGEAAVFHMIVEQRDHQEGAVARRQYSLEKCGVWHASLDSLLAHYRANQLTIRGVPGVTLSDGIPAAAVYANF